MKYSALILTAATGALASLNCTLTAPLKTYCCPNTESETVKEIPAGGLVMLGCAADDTSKAWFWNYNGLYTPTTPDVKDCNLNGMVYDDISILPDCKDDDFVLDLTEGKTSPLDPCVAECISEDNLPADTYFGDKQKDYNMASDFPTPTFISPTWPPPARATQALNV